MRLAAIFLYSIKKVAPKLLYTPKLCNTKSLRTIHPKFCDICAMQVLISVCSIKRDQKARFFAQYLAVPTQ